MELRFWKLESVGNDFVLLHEQDLAPLFESENGADPYQGIFSRLAIKLCNRRFGVGGDGLLVVRPLNEAELSLRMFNPDGTEDFCGNGLRVAALHAFHQGWVPSEHTIHHHGRVVRAWVAENGEVKTEIGPADFRAEAIPLSSEELAKLGDSILFQRLIEVNGQRIPLSSLSTGSAHTVIVVDELPPDEEFFWLSPALEHHPLFPERTSVIWTMPLTERDLQIRIWERGVGETLGCGTGSAAAAAVWALSQGQTGRFAVHNRGGIIQVGVNKRASMLTAQALAHEVFAGIWTPSSLLEKPAQAVVEIAASLATSAH